MDTHQSTYRACTMADRVVLVHDMADRTVISELDIEQADRLLEQLQLAVRQQLAAMQASSFVSACA